MITLSAATYIVSMNILILTPQGWTITDTVYGRNAHQGFDLKTCHQIGKAKVDHLMTVDGVFMVRYFCLKV